MTYIRVVDFETTGFDPPEAEVCEMGYCDLVQSADGWSVGAWKGDLYGVDAMPPQVRAIHHITLQDVSGRPKFIPEILWDALDGIVVVAAHNADFEGRFWGPAQRPVICTYKCALRVCPDAPGHSNGTLRYWLEDQGKISIDPEKAQPSHRAGPDAYVTAHILKALLTEATGAQMVAWTKEPRVFPACPIGKEWKGRPWADVDPGFLGWVLRQPDMDEDIKWNVRREIARRSEGKLT